MIFSFVYHMQYVVSQAIRCLDWGFFSKIFKHVAMIIFPVTGNIQAIHQAMWTERVKHSFLIVVVSCA